MNLSGCGQQEQLCREGNSYLMYQEVSEIFWFQLDILKKKRFVNNVYQITRGHLEIVENFLSQFLLLSVGAKGLGLQNEGST